MIGQLSFQLIRSVVETNLEEPCSICSYFRL